MDTLDPIVVIGNQYGFPGTDWETLQNNPGDADPQILAQLYQAATEFAETPQYAEYALDELIGYQNAGQTENVRKTLRAYAHADNRYAAAKTAGAPITVMEAITVFGDVEAPVDRMFPWFGGPLQPLSAFYHYAFGNGQPKSIPIEMLYLDTYWEQLDILAGWIKHPDVPRDVVSHIDGTWYRNTAKDNIFSRWTVGNIRLRLVGDVIVNSAGPFEFRGTLTASNDIYDGGVSTVDRDAFDNKATGFLSWVKNTFGATEYEVQIPGQLNLHIKGMKP